MQRYEESLLWAGDEDRFLVEFTVSRQLVTLEPEEERRKEERQSDEQLLERLKERDDQLRQELNEKAKNPPIEEGEPDVRFEVVHFSYGRANSVELIVVLGVVYAAVKDYDTVRKSLGRLMRDMQSVIWRVLDLQTPSMGSIDDIKRWEIRHRLVRRSVTVRDRATHGQTREQVVDAASRSDIEPTDAARSPARWDAGLWTVLYMVASNILLLTILGLLLLRMAP